MTYVNHNYASFKCTQTEKQRDADYAVGVN